ncbi:hypothetical protein EJ03DRAFT_28520 [Teratosphaeria nubilosa]|uniref:Uncharacterized protein n=1 Tax=Teratosphaeria nubilosa TaxID=161662 RepID=A0A6G1KUV2_9PEZI|nr:hypothetical protein EJ03DRAFT_28520 [Teratosphaeria nubilosa]
MSSQALANNLIEEALELSVDKSSDQEEDSALVAEGLMRNFLQRRPCLPLDPPHILTNLPHLPARISIPSRLPSFFCLNHPSPLPTTTPAMHLPQPLDLDTHNPFLLVAQPSLLVRNSLRSLIIIAQRHEPDFSHNFHPLTLSLFSQLRHGVVVLLPRCNANVGMRTKEATLVL